MHKIRTRKVSLIFNFAYRCVNLKAVSSRLSQCLFLFGKFVILFCISFLKYLRIILKASSNIFSSNSQLAHVYVIIFLLSSSSESHSFHPEMLVLRFKKCACRSNSQQTNNIYGEREKKVTSNN